MQQGNNCSFPVTIRVIYEEEQSKKVSMNTQQKNLSWYITPVLGVILSLPTLLTCLVFWFLAIYELASSNMQGTLLLAISKQLQPSLLGWFVLGIVFGPLFACVLCSMQLARSHQDGAVVSHMPRLTRAILLFAAVSICLLVLTGGIAFIVRGPT
jgi:hypothetical protein